MEIILMACCQRKSTGGEQIFEPSKILRATLSSMSYKRLMNARHELAEALKLSPGKDLGFSEHDSEITFLPAYQRYTGNVYKKSQIAELLPKTTSVQVLIVSALYGLVEAYDLIRDYDLSMNDTVKGTRLYTWWKRKELGKIIGECLKKLHSEKIHDLLSQAYHKALHPWPPESIKAKLKKYTYPGQGSGSNWNRGGDIKDVLTRHLDK